MRWGRKGNQCRVLCGTRWPRETQSNMPGVIPLRGQRRGGTYPPNPACHYAKPLPEAVTSWQFPPAWPTWAELQWEEELARTEQWAPGGCGSSSNRTCHTGQERAWAISQEYYVASAQSDIFTSPRAEWVAGRICDGAWRRLPCPQRGSGKWVLLNPDNVYLHHSYLPAVCDWEVALSFWASIY